MNSPLKVMSIFGTRPEAIKMAPIVLELQKYPEEIQSTVLVTAQHREMLDQVLSIFHIKPDYDLNIMTSRQTLADITTRGLTGIENILNQVHPDLILVHGDTTTTFIASLAAFYHKIPIGHVEAGLRTYDKYSPYPEEMNRQLTGILADLHFTPTEMTKANLLKENKNEHTLFVTGNTAIDALQMTVKSSYTHPILEKIGNDRFLLLTAHRRENIGAPMKRIFKGIRHIIDEFTNIQLVYPVHLNPEVREMAESVFGNHRRIHLIDPLDVIDFHNFASRAHIILTDSGGIQEEAPSLGVPVLVLRDTTERPEGIQAGTLKLAGTSEEAVYSMAKDLLTDENSYHMMTKASNPYGDGHASERIVQAILKYFYSE